MGRFNIRPDLFGLFILLFGLFSTAATAGPVHRMQLTYPGGHLRYASAVHIGDGVCLTVYHAFADHPQVNDGDWRIDCSGHPGTLLKTSRASDLAIISVPDLRDTDYLSIMPADYEPTGQITITGFPQGGDETTTTGQHAGNWSGGDDQSGLVLTCDCEEGFSGGAAVDESGYLVGIVAGHTTETRRECFVISYTTLTQLERVVPEVCPTWRPILHVWTADTCVYCRLFWNDFNSDPDFRSAIQERYRVWVLDTNRHPAIARFWRVGSIPCFGINPANRITGYSGKSALLRSLGCRPLRGSELIAPTPASPPTTPPPIISTPPAVSAADLQQLTTAIAGLSRRVADLEAAVAANIEATDQRLGLLESQSVSINTINAMSAELASLRESLQDIETLKLELSRLQQSELRVKIRQTNGNVIEDNVRLFDPNDSLNLELPEVPRPAGAHAPVPIR